MKKETNPTPLLLILGVLAFGLAGLSIADMLLPRPYDGLVLEAERHGKGLPIRGVVPGSAAEKAGLRVGDQLVGIARVPLTDDRHAGRVLQAHRIGDKLVYLVKRGDGRPTEIEIQLERRRIGDGPYFYAYTLGFAFFFVGLFVLVRQPALLTSRVFFSMSCLFLIFLVCRLRPPTYSGIDSAIMGLGTVAFLLLPAAFLHFYVLFPRPAWLDSIAQESRWRHLVWLLQRGWPLLYLVPELVFVLAWIFARIQGNEPELIGGAPAASWWLLGIFLLLGLAALRANAHHIQSQRERRGVVLVLLGSLFGLAPFIITSIWLAAGEATTTYMLAGILPLVLVPITFTYAIVRFQLLDIQIILRRSLLYTVTTALVTGLYAAGIAMFNVVFSSSTRTAKGLVPFLLALTIVLLFDPLRRRIQEVLDRSFYAGRSKLQTALTELGEAMTAQIDLQAVVRDLVERLPQILGFRFTALYRLRGNTLERVAGPLDLPASLPMLPEVLRQLQRRKGLHRLDLLGALSLRAPEVGRFVDLLSRAGVEAVADLASRRRHIGLVLFSGRDGQTPLEDEELELLTRLIDQTALALETALLLEETTQQAELERELEIAAAIQAQLLPSNLRIPSGWQVAASCRPARIVGGDFFAQLPLARSGDSALVFGDVSGKSVSGALMMMAAHEVLYTLTLAIPGLQSSELFELTNRRLCALGRRSFVALGYLETSEGSGLLRYLVAGQPPLLLRRPNGEVEELPLAQHRLPLGAMAKGGYCQLEVELEPGDLVLGYSDGVTDARAPSGEFFGEARLLKVVAEAKVDSAEALVVEVQKAVDAFVAGSPLYDDVTLVAIGRREPAAAKGMRVET